MYLHHILTRQSNSLISKVFWAQVAKPGKGDWCQVVREDLDLLGMSRLTFEDIAGKSKNSLKDLVDEHVRSTAFRDLDAEKLKLKKVATSRYDKLQIQPYLTDPKLPIRLKQLVFMWKTRMVKVGWNYGVKEQCPICLNADDTQSHLLVCEELNRDYDMNYSDKRDSYDLTEHMMRLEAAIRKRTIVLDERNSAKDDES